MTTAAVCIAAIVVVGALMWLGRRVLAAVRIALEARDKRTKHDFDTLD